MSGFLYYAPGIGAMSGLRLDEMGLAGVVPPNKRAMRGVGAGPDNAGGVVFARDGDCESVLYLPEKQKWLKAGAYWTGCVLEDLPGPADLIREDVVAGHPVEMGDGNTWIVPILRVAETGLLVPHGHAFSLTEDGTFGSSLRPEFLELGRRVEAVWDEYAGRVGMLEPGETDAVLSLDDVCRMIVDVLAINYRVEVGGVSLLGLLTGLSVQRSIEAMLDIPGLLEIVKKNRVPESQDTGDGEPVG